MVDIYLPELILIFNISFYLYFIFKSVVVSLPLPIFNLKNSEKVPTENKIRLTAFLVFILTIIYIKTHFIIIPIFLLIDFALRGSGYGKWSVLGFVAEKLVALLKLKEKPIYFPPKQFAAQVGFLFSLILSIFNLLEINSRIVSGILLICAGLEAFFNFCVGCYVYNAYYHLKNK